MLNVAFFKIIMLSVLIIYIVMLNVPILSVILLSVVAPLNRLICEELRDLSRLAEKKLLLLVEELKRI